MSDINTITLTGRLAKDFECRMGNNNTAYGTFRIAVSDYENNVELTYFYDIKVIGHNANYVQKYTQKGTLVSVCGKLVQRKYTDKNNQQQVVYEIKANSVVAAKASQPTQQGQEPKQETKPVQQKSFEEISDDDLPF